MSAAKAVAFLIGALPLVGCGVSPERRAIVANATLLADDLDARAENLEDAATAAPAPAARNGLEAAAENLHDAADDVRDAGTPRGRVAP